MKKLLFMMMIASSLNAASRTDVQQQMPISVAEAIRLEEERRVILQEVNRDSAIADCLSKLSESLQLQSLPKLIKTRFTKATKLFKLLESQKLQALPLLAGAQLVTLKMLCKKPESLQLELQPMISEIQSIIVDALKERLNLSERLMSIVLESDELITEIPHQMPDGLQ